MRGTIKSGFTIVELLIVVVVIAILAAIVIVSYNGISKQAHQSSLMSDAHSVANIMSSDQALGGSYATSEGAANGGKGLPASDGTSYIFHSDGQSYCVTAKSSYDGVESYYVSSSNPTPTRGQCPGDGEAVATTVAGNGTLGFVNGDSTVSRVASPAAIVADASGNLYFTDGSTSRIRKLTTAGVVSTLAGNGGSGYVEGTGTGATFNWPQAMTIDASGILVIADTHSQKIRKLTLAGVSSYFAGSTQGTTGAVGTAASSIKFNDPRGIVYDPTTNTIVVADSQNNRIIRSDSSGNITAIYGSLTGGFANGSASVARFNYPEGLAIDSSGTIYVADTNNHRIRKISPSGQVDIVAGNGTIGTTDGTGTAAKFNKPSSLTIASDGTLYVADTENSLIRKITTGGVVTTIAGTGTAGFAEGTGTNAQFNKPIGIAIGSDGRLYVTDTGNHRIRALTL